MKTQCSDEQKFVTSSFIKRIDDQFKEKSMTDFMTILGVHVIGRIVTNKTKNKKYHTVGIVPKSHL